MRLLNIIATGAADDGFIKVFECSTGDHLGPTSTMNFPAGATIAHLSFVSFEGGDDLCARSTADVDLVIDDYGEIIAEGPLTFAVHANCVTVHQPTDFLVETLRPFDPNGTDPDFTLPGPGPPSVEVYNGVAPYTLTASSQAGLVVELRSENDSTPWLEFGIGSAPPGRHVVDITVRDNLGATARGSVFVDVLEAAPNPQQLEAFTC